MIKNTIDKCLNKVSKNSLKCLRMLQKLWHNMSYKKVSPPWIHSSFESARDPRDLGVTLRAFLSPLRHMQQLLSVSSCDWPAEIGASLRTDAQRTNERTHWRTDRLLCLNSILDVLQEAFRIDISPCDCERWWKKEDRIFGKLTS
jgi:hypothetical protein